MYGLRPALTLAMTMAFTAAIASGLQPEPASHSTPPSSGTRAAQPEPASEMSVDQAIRAAIDALDKLESAGDSDTISSLLEEFNRTAELVQTSAPENPWLQYLYGRAYAVTGRRGDAIDLLRKFVETREGRNEWRAHRILGDLFVDQFPRLARANYVKAVALKDNEPTVLFGLSRCAAMIGDYDEAIRLAERTAAADGRRTLRYLNHFAGVLMSGQQWIRAKQEAKAALHLAEEAVRRQPGEPGPRQILDFQLKLMVDVLNGSAGETPDAPGPYLEAARYLRARGDNAARLNLFQVLGALEIGVKQTAPNTPPKLIEEYARTLAEVGRKDAAIAEFEKLLAMDPSNPVAAEWLRRLRETPPEAGPPADP